MWKSKFYGAFTPLTRRLLDVACSTQVATGRAPPSSWFVVELDGNSNAEGGAHERLRSGDLQLADGAGVILNIIGRSASPDAVPPVRGTQRRRRRPGRRPSGGADGAAGARPVAHTGGADGAAVPAPAPERSSDGSYAGGPARVAAAVPPPPTTSTTVPPVVVAAAEAPRLLPTT